jgi:hypothetical protein
MKESKKPAIHKLPNPSQKDEPYFKSPHTPVVKSNLFGNIDNKTKIMIMYAAFSSNS